MYLVGVLVGGMALLVGVVLVLVGVGWMWPWVPICWQGGGSSCGPHSTRGKRRGEGML